MLTIERILRSDVIRSWKMGLSAWAIASFLAGCQIFPPDESISAPSVQLREALGSELAPIAIYGGVGSPHSNGRGVLILAQDSLQFRDWYETGRYEAKGLKIPYANIDFVYIGKGDYFTQKLVVIERCDSCKGGYPEHYFTFEWNEARRNSAHQTLLSLIDRTDTTHLPSPEMWNARDRVVAVTKADYEPVVEWGISLRAGQGAGIGAAPLYPFIYLGGYQLVPYAIVLGAIGGTVGAAIGLAEELSDSEQVRAVRREMTAQLKKAALIQTWLLDSVMTLVLKQGATANARENGHLFTRIDDLSKKGYRSVFREAIDHALEVRVLELRIIATDSKDKKEVQDMLFELRGNYSVKSMAQGGRYPATLAHGHVECRSSSYPVTAWQVDDAKLFGEELHSCIDQLGEKIVSDFLARFPDATSLRKQKDSTISQPASSE
jgi:hypothetical protein